MTVHFKTCSCNRTIPLDAETGRKLGAALGTEPVAASTQLCGREANKYLSVLNGSDTVVVGCTQEKSLFTQLAQENNAYAPIRFVNLRDRTDWHKRSRHPLPKMAALLAEAALPEADPVPTVNYASQGKLLIIGPADSALKWAESLCEQLPVHVLLTGPGSGHALPVERRYAVFSGSAIELNGWLGNFTVQWQQDNPIDLDLCVRCNACIQACPEGAIDFLYQVDAEKCQRHGKCVDACGEIEAIQFTRSANQRNGEYDLVFDLSDSPHISCHQPPYGYYFARHNDPDAQMKAILSLLQMTGEFEKPKYFQYKEKLCAHGRNRKTGCHACIDICSAQAIRSKGNGIEVAPHLCAGCGACTTVCPTGAINYAYPNAPHTGRRLKTLLHTYAKAGGERPGLLFHSDGGLELINQLSRMASGGKTQQGMPSNVIPVQLHHTASVGMDVWLTAVAYGACSVAVLLTGDEAPQYFSALKHQASIAQAILSELGYSGAHLQLIEARSVEDLDHALGNMTYGEVPGQTATFNAFAEKRNTLDFALDHLYRHAPVPKELVSLPAGAPFGTLKINTAACTLCMSCIGSCPSSALISSGEKPQLRIIEKNCVQCGLCVATCPEQAISLLPQLNLSQEAKQAVILNETQPFQCIRCHKPFSTLKMVEGMLARLSEHSAFSGNLDRIKMCGDCRVIDMMEARKMEVGNEFPVGSMQKII